MARLTYAALGLALAALVSGFFVRDSTIPLYASILLSAVVSVLIMTGWTRRLRREGAFGEEGGARADETEIVEIDIDELDDDERPARPVRPARTDRAESAERTVRFDKPAAPSTMRDRIRQELAELRQAEPPPAPVVLRERAPAPGVAKVFVHPGREKYHTRTCRYAKGPEVREVRESVAIDRGYVACGVCMKKIAGGGGAARTTKASSTSKR